MRWRSMVAAGFAATIVATGCSQDAEQAILAPESAAFTVVTPTGYVNVAKFGPAGTYEFEKTTPAGTSTFFLAAGATTSIWTMSDPLAPLATVTITENVPANMQVDSIRVVVFENEILIRNEKLTGTNTASATNLSNLTDVFFKVYNSELPPPPPGMQGCTPGYWKQSQHFDSWVGYTPGQSFAAVFGVAYNATLLEALSNNGGGVAALARHAVAALLSASSPGVDYPATVAEVIAATQAAFASGNYETQKDIFDGWNNLGCMLD